MGEERRCSPSLYNSDQEIIPLAIKRNRYMGERNNISFKNRIKI